MSSLGFCKCGKQLIPFTYEVLAVGKKYEFIGIKCSECDYKMPEHAIEIKRQI